MTLLELTGLACPTYPAARCSPITLQPSIAAKLVGIGCFWGAGNFESDCTKMCYTIFTVESGCT